MAFSSELTLNITTSQLVKSSDQPDPLALAPLFSVGEVRELKVRFVRNSQAGAGAVSIVSGIGTSLQVFFGDPGNPVSSATAPPSVNDIYTVTLPLDIAAVSAFLDTAVKRTTTLEFQLVSSTLKHDYRVPVVLCCPVGSPTFVDPAPPDTGLGTITANALYVPQDGLPGGARIIRSANGLYAVREYLGDDGEMHYDPIAP